uniref:Uncharacterized protein n=1 Tax=Coccidioides posadasii RMSCC 3488 TaxID=454284 RepID=A0A0J6FK23_COCPO|nr:hypothetical protein CPAG_09814 [Coccidioides posadasii RMSCC 3488]
MFTHKQEQKIKCCPVKYETLLQTPEASEIDIAAQAYDRTPNDYSVRDATMRDFLAYTRENFCASSIAVVRLFAVAKNGTSLANIHD